MERSDRFGDLESELATSGSIRTEKSRTGVTSEDPQAKELRTELAKRLAESKHLSNIKKREKDPFVWSLICGTAYDIGPTKEKSLEALTCRAIHNASESVIGRRKKLLQMENAANLRFRLWIQVNQWLRWNPSGISARSGFEFWDGLADEAPTVRELYSRGKRTLIDALLREDIKRLGELGNFLATCAALCNNPTAQRGDRVISLEIYRVVKRLMEVRKEPIVRETMVVTAPLLFSSPKRGWTGNGTLCAPPTRNQRRAKKTRTKRWPTLYLHSSPSKRSRKRR